MKKSLLLSLAALPVLLSSCATPQPPQAYHNTDNTALVIDAMDARSSRIVMPTPSGPIGNDQILTTAKNLPQHQTAVVILENYTEAEAGDQFRDRGTPWFIGLRCLGYEHIVFLHGNGAGNPEGLLTVAKYD
ncbi:MAG TPA: hypothetical protein VG347_23020 [Verrucomicrobiae bacterium]|nr:hypothetical protein [Verrucomicrobiae bacterium]